MCVHTCVCMSLTVILLEFPKLCLPVAFAFSHFIPLIPNPSSFFFLPRWRCQTQSAVCLFFFFVAHALAILVNCNCHRGRKGCKVISSSTHTRIVPISEGKAAIVNQLKPAKLWFCECINIVAHYHHHPEAKIHTHTYIYIYILVLSARVHIRVSPRQTLRERAFAMIRSCGKRCTNATRTYIHKYIHFSIKAQVCTRALSSRPCPQTRQKYP